MAPTEIIQPHELAEFQQRITLSAIGRRYVKTEEQQIDANAGECIAVRYSVSGAQTRLTSYGIIRIFMLDGFLNLMLYFFVFSLYDGGKWKLQS